MRAVLACLAALAASSVLAANMMEDGGFEKWNDAKGQPSGSSWRWGFSQKGTNGFSVCELSETERHGGRTSLHLRDSNAGRMNHAMWYQFAEPELKEMAGKTVRASAWIKQVSASNPRGVGIAGRWHRALRDRRRRGEDRAPQRTGNAGGDGMGERAGQGENARKARVRPA